MPLRFLKLMQPLRAVSLVLALAAGTAPHWAAAQSVTSFTVVNADTGADIATFTSSGQISIAQTPHINIRANAAGVRSVVLTDASAVRRIENGAPYAYMGDINGVYNKWRPAAGTYVIRAAPFAQINGSGVAGATATLTLTLTTGAAAPVAITRSDAQHFLARASFGPDEASISEVIRLGYSGWIDAQFAMPNTNYLADQDAEWLKTPEWKRSNTSANNSVHENFWILALARDNQLRARVQFALSQIFVVSLRAFEVGGNPRGAAHYLDMLGDKGFTTYRELLEAVTLHPMMGFYLDSFQNQKPDGNGRVPDLNFAREIAQLFSIGPVMLNQDGTVQRSSNGSPIPSYTSADLAGLSHVFTGLSYRCRSGELTQVCWEWGGHDGPFRLTAPMQSYPAYYSLDEKRFLGQTIPARPGGATHAQQLADLKLALDTLARHPNTAPFISKQLIQRLVGSNPSPAYVRRVAGVFTSTGGDMKAVIKAILTDSEAFARNANAAKLREPVLALSAYLRAFKHSSFSGRHNVYFHENPSMALAQEPFRANSVFNFFRPGYVAPNSNTAAVGLVSPEQQILDETTAASWVNYMMGALNEGLGVANWYQVNGQWVFRRDLQRDWPEELAMASDSVALVRHVTDRLLYGRASLALTQEIERAVNSVPVDAAAADASNAAAVQSQRLNRVRIAVLLALASPEFLVQK